MSNRVRRPSQTAISSTPGSPSSVSPAHSSPAQDGSIRRQILRRGSTTNSLSVQTPQIVESGPNAISTLLQAPILRTGLRPNNTAFKAPTAKDIPPVTLTNIEHVDSKAFQPYLTQIGSLYEAVQRAKNEVEEDEVALFHRSTKPVEDWEAVLNKKLPRPAHARLDSTSSISSPTKSPTTLQRRSSIASRKHAATPLSTVPSVYGQDNFQLENPRTFDVVSERSEIAQDPKEPPTGRKTLANNAILQEKLSWYMDTVEVHLISSISTASKSFFSALGALRQLHEEAEDSVKRIQKLRSDLARLDREMAQGGLKVLRLKQRRDNVRKLAEAMMQLQDVVDAVQDCEDMIENGKIDGALDDLDDVDRLIAGQDTRRLYRSRSESRYTAIDLRRMQALDNARLDLNNLRIRAGRAYEARFQNCLLNDMRQHVKDTESSVTLQRWGYAFNRARPGVKRTPSMVATYMQMSPEFRVELEQAMQGLQRARSTTSAVTNFRTAILREMKAMIRRQLPSSNDDDTVSIRSASTVGGRKLDQAEKSSILARNIRAMDSIDFYDLLVTVYTNVSESLRRLSIQVKILLDVTSTLDQIASPRNSEDGPRTGRARAQSIQAEMQQALDLSSLLGEAVDAMQTQITKVIRVRAQQNMDMLMPEFVRFVTLNRLFIEECEAICGQSGHGLRTTVNAQINEYVAQYSKIQVETLVNAMDNDKWEAKDFSDHYTTILNRVVEGGTSDAQAWLATTQIWNKPLDHITDGTQTVTPETNGATNGTDTPPVKEKVRQATLDTQKYILSTSPLTLLTTLDSTQHLIVSLPFTSPDLATTTLEVLRTYNSRTSQLILGAGATRTAGLKNITTKHLALSSQGLSFAIALTPYVREFFRRYLPPNSSTSTTTLAEFDKTRRMLQEHQVSIHEKLVEIMSSRAAAHIRSMLATDFSALASEDDSTAEVSPYMQTLCKETATLQKVLAKHLPEGQLMSIMMPVFQSYKTQFAEALGKVEIKDEKAKRGVERDVEYLKNRMDRLDGGEGLGEGLLGILRGRTVGGAGENADGGGQASMK